LIVPLFIWLHWQQPHFNNDQSQERRIWYQFMMGDVKPRIPPGGDVKILMSQPAGIGSG
jgi:hypothetical protein